MIKTVIGVEKRTKTKLLPLYRVLLHNDDVNDMPHVTSVLMRVFRFDSKKSLHIMLEAHSSGVALCTTEPKEHAEFHQEQLQAYSLIATIEPG